MAGNKISANFPLCDLTIYVEKINNGYQELNPVSGCNLADAKYHNIQYQKAKMSSMKALLLLPHEYLHTCMVGIYHTVFVMDLCLFVCCKLLQRCCRIVPSVRTRWLSTTSVQATAQRTPFSFGKQTVLTVYYICVLYIYICI